MELFLRVGREGCEEDQTGSLRWKEEAGASS